MAMNLSFRQICAIALSLSLAWSSARAESGEPLRLIELFTSHGCSSCPSADRLLGELLHADESLMALEYHVDYWNTLVHGSAGNWVDPFSSREYTDRQREYNDAELAGQRGVYTPQAVVNGRFVAVGSNRPQLQQALARAAVQQLDIGIAQTAAQGGQQLRISISGSDDQLGALAGTDVTLVRYLDSATTPVTGGENKDRELTNHHIVIAVENLGELQAGRAHRVKVEAPGADEGCIVVVQKGASSPVHAAAECP